MEITSTSEGLFISQTKYTRNVLERFSMQDCKEVPTPLEPASTKEAEENCTSKGGGKTDLLAVEIG